MTATRTVSLGPFGRDGRWAPIMVLGMPNATPADIVPFRKLRRVIEFMPQRLPQIIQLQQNNVALARRIYAMGTPVHPSP